MTWVLMGIPMCALRSKNNWLKTLPNHINIRFLIGIIKGNTTVALVYLCCSKSLTSNDYACSLRLHNIFNPKSGDFG